MVSTSRQPGGTRLGPAGFVYLALPLSLLAVLMALAAGPGYQFGWWDYPLSFRLLRWAEWVSYAGLALGLVALHLCASRRRWRLLLLQLVAFAACVSVVVAVNQYWRQARSVPPIHDITTDTQEPPRFEAVASLRGEQANPLPYPGPEVAAQQQAAYPDVMPLEVRDSPASAFSAARDVIQEFGWEVVAVESARGRIEAVATTPWFGFRDDVVVRIRAAERGSRVDIRSKSRVGRSDLGANAERIRRFLTAMQRRTQPL